MWLRHLQVFCILENKISLFVLKLFFLIEAIRDGKILTNLAKLDKFYWSLKLKILLLLQTIPSNIEAKIVTAKNSGHFYYGVSQVMI